jgi:hypothetical protein
LIGWKLKGSFTRPVSLSDFEVFNLPMAKPQSGMFSGGQGKQKRITKLGCEIGRVNGSEKVSTAK